MTAPLPAPPRSRRRGHAALISAVAIGCVLAAFIAVLATRKSAANQQAPSPLLGKAAPDLSGIDLTGKSVSLAQFQGKYVFVNFFASWCPPCQREEPELEKWATAHATKGDAAVLGVLFMDTPANARAFVAQNGGSWPILIDPAPDYPAALHFGVREPPESFLVNPQGIVLAKFLGAVTAAGLDQILAEAQA